MVKIRPKFLLTILVFIVVIFGFFSIYNYFLLDNSIERIRTSLQQLSQATSLSEAEAVTFLMQDLFVNEVSDSQVDLQRLVATEAFESAFTSPELNHRKHDVQFLLENLLSGHEKKRTPALLFFDRMIQYCYNRFYNLLQFGQYLMSKLQGRRHFKTALEESQLNMLRQARELELKWQFADAASIYERFLKNYPDYEKRRLVHLNLASVFLRSGRYDDAERLLSEIPLTNAPTNEVKLISLLQKKKDQLKDLAREREGLEQRITRLRQNKTGPVLGQKRKEESTVVTRLKRAETEKLPTDLVSLTFRLGVIHIHLFDLGSAKKSFQEVLGLNPSEDVEKQAMWVLGWIHLLENNFQEGRRLMTELLQKFPVGRYGEMSSFALAAISERSGDYLEAAKEFERLSGATVSKDTSFLLKYRAGSVYLYDLKDLSNALRAFTQTQKLVPTPFLSNALSQVFPNIQGNMREIAFQKLLQGDIKTAKEFFAQILKLNPEDAWGHCGYGVALYLDGEQEEGLKHVTQCRSLTKDPYTNSAVAYLNEKEGKTEEAILLYRDAIRERKDYTVALYNLGCLELQTDQADEAVEHLKEAKRQAERLGRYKPPYANNLGLAYLHVGRVRDAESEFLAALQWDPNFPEAHYNLAKLYQGEGRADLAARHLKAVSSETVVAK